LAPLAVFPPRVKPAAASSALVFIDTGVASP
jgi:hypothetical protein